MKTLIAGLFLWSCLFVLGSCVAGPFLAGVVAGLVVVGFAVEKLHHQHH